MARFDSIITEYKADTKQAIKSTDAYTASLEKQEKQANQTKIALQELMNLPKATQQKLVDLRNINDKYTKSTIYDKNGTPNITEKFVKDGKEYTYINDTLKSTRLVLNDVVNKKKEELKLARQQLQEQKQINKEEEKSNKNQKKTNKLWGAFKRITFYRTVRRAIQLVTQGLGQGLENVRSIDVELDKTLKNFSNAGTAIKNSFGSILGELLKTIEPLVITISDTLGKFVNKINEAKAVTSGASTYTKILTSDTKEWKEQLEDVGKTLLSFDKFESLEKQQYTGVVEAQVTMSPEEANTTLATLSLIEASIASIGIAIGALKLEKVLSSVSSIKGVLLSTTNVIVGAGGLISALEGIKGLVDDITNISKWNEGTSGLQKFRDVMWTVFDVVAVIAGLIAFITGNWVAGGIAVMSAIFAHIGRTSSANERGYATGGIPEKSEMFYMNEYGKPEALVNTGGTQTNVINIEQLTYGMKQGFVQAIYETGLLDAMQSTVVVEGRNIDNNAVARGLFNALKTESTRRGGNQL